MAEFFTDDFRAEGYDSSLKSAFQGQLASSYTNALSNLLETASVADWIGFLAHSVNGLSIGDALAVEQAVLDGAFSLDGLFSAAQSKTAAVDGAQITDPSPTLTVVIGEGDSAQIVVIDLTAILSGLDTETWTQTDTTGGGKKATTVTTFHTREFYADADQPDGYTANWHDSAPPPANEPPTAEAIIVNAIETQSIWEDPNLPGYEHAIQNTDPDVLTVDLIVEANASDPDPGEVLHVVGGSVSLAGGGGLPDYIVVEGDTIKIDQNSRLLDYLKADPNGPDHSLTIDLTYEITDGVNTIENTVSITITGTADEYQLSGDGESAPVTYTGAQMNVTANSGLLTVGALPDGFDFSFTGSITATASGLNSDTPAEKITIADGNGNDWGDPAINLTVTHTTETQTLDIADALADGKVDFNVTKNGSVDVTDSVTLTLNYHYDYWIMA